MPAKRNVNQVEMSDVDVTQELKEYIEHVRSTRKPEDDYIPEDTLEGASERTMRREEPAPPPEPKFEAVDFEGAIRTSKQRSIALEKGIAQVLSGLLVIGTVRLFGVHNALLKEEAESITEPAGRIFGRHFGNRLRALIPLGKIKNQADRADAEEIIATVGVYLFRIIMQTWSRIQRMMELKKISKENPQLYAAILEQMRQTQTDYGAAGGGRRGGTTSPNVPPPSQGVKNDAERAAESAARAQYAAAMAAVGHITGETPDNIAQGKVLMVEPDGLVDGVELTYEQEGL